MSHKTNCKPSLVHAVLAMGLMVVPFGITNAQEPLGRALSANVNLAGARTAFEALPENDRKAIQDALIWTGLYSGVADGVFGRQTFDAIGAYQQSRRVAPTGILDPGALAALQTSAQTARKTASFILQDDPKSGVRIGVPTSLLPKKDVNPNGGSRWQSADGRVTLDTRTAPPDATLPSLYDRNLAIQTPGRIVTYKVLRPDFMVIAGETPTGKFYTRYDARDVGVRGFSIGYDKALAPQFDRLVVAIANSFDPFPAPAATPVPAPIATAPRPQPTVATEGRRLIGTGIAIAARQVLTAAPVGSCRDPRVADMPVALVQAGNAWTKIDLPRDVSSPISPPRSNAGGDQEVLVLAYMRDGLQPSLTAVPGLHADPQSIIAPLQQGAAGAPVIDGMNRLVGVVGPVGDSGAKVAGVMTTARYTIIPSRDFASAISMANDDPTPAVKSGAAEIVARWRSALLPITCGS